MEGISVDSAPSPTRIPPTIIRSNGDKCCFCLAGFGVLLAILLAIGMLFGLATVNLVFASHYKNDVCLAHGGTDLFSYYTWMLVYGWIRIGIVLAGIVGICFGTLCGAFSLDGMYTCIMVCSCPISTVLGSYAIFSMVWMLLGAVILFSDVAHDCGRQHPIYKLGLATFIIEYLIQHCANLAVRLKTTS